MNASPSDHRFNFGDSSPSSSHSAPEDTKTETKDNLTIGTKPPGTLAQRSSESRHDIGPSAEVSSADHNNTSMQTLPFVETPSPQSRKRPRRSHSEYVDSPPIAGPSRLRLELSLPSAKRFKPDENDSESVGSRLTSSPSPTSSNGVEDTLLSVSNSQLSVSTVKFSDTAISREEGGIHATPKPAVKADAHHDANSSPRISSAKLPAGKADTTSADAPSSSSSRTPLGHLAEYTCPICFQPPSYATMTPCGHVCCGECLFTAVKTTIQRGAYMGPEAEIAKCPVCRASIPGWDGRGGGVIGLQPRVVPIPEGSEKPR